MGLEPPRPKEAVTNCMLAHESPFYGVMRELRLEITKFFAKDLLAVANKDPEFMVDGLKRPLQGAFGYLSVKGPHSHTQVDQQNLPEGTSALDYTYLVVSHFLGRFIALKRRDTRPSLA